MTTRMGLCKSTIAGLLLMLVLWAGCGSMDGGDSLSGSAYYGVGFSDPWYYGGYDNDADIIVTPPHPERPDGRPRPVHPIARPPSGIGSSPRPMPSIPSSPRPSGRR